jgi:hypothetical protein
MHLSILTIFSDAGFVMRQAQQLAEQSVEVSTYANWCSLGHSGILFVMTDENLLGLYRSAQAITSLLI